MFNFFKGRRQRESAVPPSEVEAIQKPTDVEPVGQMFPTEQGAGIEGERLDLGQMIGMFREAAKSGQPQIALGSAEVLNAQGTEMGEQIRALLSEHGISQDVHSGEAASVTDPEDLQRQIMEVLSQNGIDVPKMMGGQASAQVDPHGETAPGPDPGAPDPGQNPPS